MTAATRDRRSEPDDEEIDGVRWNDRALFGSFRGLPWWAAVLIAFVLAIIGTYVDVSGSKTVGWVFAVTFFVGAVGAVVFVERRSMFGPVVQPPLVLAIVVPLVVLVTQGMPTGGLTSVALTLGRPLIDGFPAMAITTLCTVALGIFRVTKQKDPNRPTKDEVREAKRKPEKPEPEARKRPRPAEPAEERPRSPRSGDRSRPARAGRPSTDQPRPRKPRPRDED